MEMVLETCYKSINMLSARGFVTMMKIVMMRVKHNFLTEVYILR